MKIPTLKYFFRKLAGFHTRWNYWSGSKLARWFYKQAGMKPNPISASFETWAELDEYNKKVNPIVFWIVDTGLDTIQDIVYFPYDVYRNFKYYIINRFVDRTHLIDTKLTPGKWHEVDTVLLHGIMETVVNYVEVQLAHKHNIGCELGDCPIIIDKREAGLVHLDWEISLGEESPVQSERAKVVKEVYLWWKDERPKRPDPHDVTGWTEYCEEFGWWPDRKDEDKDRAREIIEELNFLDEFYYTVDSDMMKKVIDIRQGMWT